MHSYPHISNGIYGSIFFKFSLWKQWSHAPRWCLFLINYQYTIMLMSFKTYAVDTTAHVCVFKQKEMHILTTFFPAHILLVEGYNLQCIKVNKTILHFWTLV